MFDVIQGNNSPNIVATASGLDFSAVGWNADLYVLDPKQNFLVSLGPLPMVLSSNKLNFSIQLSPTQTKALSAQQYKLAIEVYNDSLNFKQTKYEIINIIHSLVP